MNTEIVYDNHLMYTDNMILNPHKFNLEELGLYENYWNFSSLIAINEKIDENFVKKMQKEIQKDPHCNFGISKLEGPGLVARILG